MNIAEVVIFLTLGSLALGTTVVAVCLKRWELAYVSTVPCGFVAIALVLALWPNSPLAVDVCKILAKALALLYVIAFLSYLTQTLKRVIEANAAESSTIEPGEGQ